MFSGGSNATNDQTAISIGYGGSNEIFLHGPTGMSLRSQALLDQTGEWYHLVVAMDTTQAVASDRVKIYLDGQQLDSFTSPTYPAQNTDLGIGKAAGHAIGRFFDYDVNHINGDLADVAYVDGQALDASAFGQADGNGGWVAGGDGVSDYGTNGFRFDFTDSGNLGKDMSGNGNDYTVNGSLSQGTAVPAVGQAAADYTGTDGNDVLVGDDQTASLDGGLGDDLLKAGDLAEDVGKQPSDIVWDTALSGTSAVIDADGVTLSATAYDRAVADRVLEAGRIWYWEINQQEGPSIYRLAGLANSSFPADSSSDNNFPTGSVTYKGNGEFWVDGAIVASFEGYGDGDVISFAYSADDNRIWVAKNGVWQNGSPSDETGGTAIPDDDWRVMFGTSEGSQTVKGQLNFGAGAFQYPDLVDTDIVDGTVLSGGSGDDTLIGGAGDDTLIGSSGEDIARYDGAMAGYTVTNNGDGTYSVTGASVGTDMLTGIEKIHFDANGDGIINKDPEGNPTETVIDLTKENGPVASDGKIVLDGGSDSFIHKLSIADADLDDTDSTESLTVTIEGAVNGALEVTGGTIQLIDAAGNAVASNNDGLYKFTPGTVAADAPSDFTFKVVDGTQMESRATVKVGVGDAVFALDHSVALNGTTDYLSWTPAAAGDRKTWTFSTWVKLDSLSPNQMLFTSKAGDGHFYLWVNDSGKLAVGFNGPSGPSDVISTAAIGDTGWHQIVLSVDTTQANQADRMRLYLDGNQAGWNDSSSFDQNAEYASARRRNTGSAVTMNPINSIRMVPLPRRP